MQTQRSLTVSILLVSALAVGCGGQFQVVPVSGTVTLDGKPLEDATVTFTPVKGGEDSPISTGRTDKNGKYNLSVVADESSGAVVGQHTVGIAVNIIASSDIMTPEERAKAELPPHSFTFEVKSGKNTADFALESKKKK
jgi:hypothetical protein